MKGGKHKFFLVLLSLLGSLFFVVPAFAQDIGTQINQGLNYATVAGLGTRDIREVIFLIINVILGFLSIIAVILILYAGFVWMTAGGDSEKIAQAKRIIINAVIGLVIILASFAIAAFISRMLANITGSGDGISGVVQPKEIPKKDGSNYCIIKNIKPYGPQKIYNLAVRIEFNRNIDGKQVIDSGNIKIIEKNTNKEVKGSYKVSGKIIEFLPEKNCGPEAPNKKCFEKDTEYRIEIPDKSLVCGGAILDCNYTPLNPDEKNFGCVAVFTSGNILDLKNPELKDLRGQVCEDKAKITVDVRDDSEVNMVELFVLQDRVSQKTGKFGENNIFEEVKFDDWNPQDHALLKNNNVTLQALAHDADTNSSDISKDFRVAPAHCCNGVKDSEEEDTDCGGSCSVACPQAPGDTGPIIVDFDPKQGPAGTYVTISGFRFGKSKGQVEFAGAAGTFDFPLACIIDQGYWTDSRIIVKAPATGGEIQVIRNDDKKSNILKDKFVIEGNPKPGICKISPDNGIPEVTQPKIYGERLLKKDTVVFFSNKDAFVESSGTEQQTTYLKTTVPKEAQTGDIFVRSDSNKEESNPLFFKVGACTASSCSAEQECCSAGPFVKSCMLKGQCLGSATRSSYRWSFVTGTPGPRVKEGCTRTNQCSKGGYSSPTPLFARDNDVPINSAISARFTEPMQQNTLNSNTIHIRECLDEKQNCNDITVIETSFNFIPDGSHKIVGFIYYPPSNLKSNTWYEVVLNADKIFSEKGEELQGNISDTLYTWQFKTMAHSTLAGLGCVDCSPDKAYISEKDKTQDYTGSVYSKGQACVMLNAGSYSWKWTSSDEQKATLSFVGGNARATAIADSGKNPVDIKAEIKDFENNPAICKLFIDFTTPYVTDYWPNCGSVCKNAEAGALLNVVLDVKTITTKTVQLYWCGTDYECNKDLKDNNLISLNGPILNKDNKKITFTPHSNYFNGNFIPGAYYRVVLKGGKDGIASAEGKLLGGLNFDHPVNDGLSGPDSFSWTFKVSDNPALCKVSRIAVEPAQALVPVDGIERYFAQPYSLPDRCSNTGQRLNPYLYDWAWESKDEKIAELIRPLVDACGNGIIEPGEECDDGNASDNDLCSYPTCLNKGTTAVKDKGTCGNKKKDPGEDCDPPGEFCSDTCLNKGNKNDPTTVVCGNGKIETGEECDDRNNLDGDGCNKFCIAEGSIAGVSVCGDGIVGKGESCESCENGKITSGSCPKSDFARDITPTGNDECSATCTTEPLPQGVTIQAPYPVCGNKLIDIGEEQDVGNESIADSCLVTGSSYEKNKFKPGPYQWARAKGKVNDKTEIEAEASAKKGSGEFIIVGKHSLFQIISHQPTGANNCQNQFALARFNAPINPQSLINKVKVEQRKAKSQDKWEPYTKHKVELKNTEQDIVKIFPENGKWEAGKEFQITFLPDIQDISGKLLDCSNKLCQWSFSVGNFLCEPTRVEVTPPFASVAPGGEATYNADALGKYKEPSLENQSQVKISGRLSCDTDATICLTSKGDGAFSINAYEKGILCNSPAKKKELLQLTTEGVIQKGVLFLGCGIGAEFGTDTKKWPKKDDILSFDFLKGFSPSVTNISFNWTHQELTDDFGNPAIEKSESIDSNSQKFIAASFDITKDPMRHARVKAHISDNAAIFDIAEFFVGDICRDRYGSGDLYGVYPLKTENDTLFLMHFDDTLKAETRTRSIDPLVSKNLSFISGLTDNTNTLGKSVQFKNGAELLYPAKGNIDPKKGSISLWLNLASLNSAEILRLDGNNNSMVLSIQDVNGKVDFSYGDEGIVSLKSITIDTWHNVVALWESELEKEAKEGNPAEYLIKLKLYVNNELLAEDEISGAQILELDDTSKIHIGSNKGKFIDGSLDELEIRSQILSEENIRKRFTAKVSCLGKAEGGDFKVLEKGPNETVCMNPQVFATFNLDIDPASINKKNVVMCEGDSCTIDDKNVIEDLSYNVPAKTVSIKKPSILKPNITYNIHVRGGLDGVKSKDGRYLSDSENWNFITKDTLCSCDRAKIMGYENNGSIFFTTPVSLAVDYFYCVGNSCPIHRPTDYDFLPVGGPQGSGLGNDHLYTAQCNDVDNGKETEVNSSDLKFLWEWDKKNPKSVISAVHINTDEDLTQQQQYVTNSRNIGVGSVKVLIEGKGNKEPTNPVKGNGSASVTIYNNICSSPWPRAGNYKDTEYNWDFWYCRDQGDTTTLDDLPALKEPEASLYPVDIAGTGGSLLKEVVFPAVYYLSSTPVTIAVIKNEPHIMEFTGKGKETKDIKEPTVLAFTSNNFSDVPKREACVFASAQEAEWKHEFIIPEDGSYQLYLQIFNYSGNKDKQANPANNDVRFTLKAEIGSEIIGTITPIADTKDQFVFFDLNYRKAGTYMITITSSNNGETKDLWEKHFALCRVGLSKQTKVNDIMGVRVFKNPLHLSPKTWYQSGVCSGIKPENATIDDVCANDSYCALRKEKTTCVFNVPNRGSFSELTVDGYPAARSGRTVYVDAANQSGQDLFTNIYLFSYNENAHSATIAIFDELLKNWKFTGGIKDNFWDKVRKDVRRAGDITDMKIALRDFFHKNGYYPLWDTVRKQLSGGTYIPGLSLSVWPSWKNTFEKSLGVSLPVDPVNDLKICPPLECGAGKAGEDNFCQVNPDTCWDETRLEFYCPEYKNVYGYRSRGNTYDIGTSYEYADWDGNLDKVLGNGCKNVNLGDMDGDGKKDDADNCDPRKDCKNPFDCSNPQQEDKDSDGRGDICDICEGKENDNDHDGLCGDDDNCPNHSNPDQKDSNSDSTGDACETECALDSDKDGECDTLDNCPFVYNPDQADTDGGSGPDCNSAGAGQCCSPHVPRYCAPHSPNTSAIGLSCSQDYNPDLPLEFNCATDKNTPKDSWNFCKTPDQINGQIWPHGRSFGDACDPNTDPDNDGFPSGFCGGFTSNKPTDFRLCQTDDDCEGFVIPHGSQAPYSANVCRKLPASDTTRMDNCSYIKDSKANSYAATHNIGQEDFDKDLVGYMCDTCIDSDDDKYTDGIINEGFENGLGGWTIVDGKLERSTNYRHLNEVLRKPSDQDDTSYRGVHAAWIRGGGKRMMLKQFLPGPARFSDILSENRVFYTARAWVRSQGAGEITMKVMRACTNNKNEKEREIKFSAKCHGSADFGLSVSSSSDTWALLKVDFYVNYESAQDGLVFIFDTEKNTSAEYFIDDFQVFYRTIANSESCVSDEQIDLCPNFSNPDVCVGGSNNGKICQSDEGCKPKVVKSSAQGSVLGVEIKKVTSALKDLERIDIITFYEASKITKDNPAPGIKPYEFKKDDPKILNKMPETDFSNKNNCDFLTGDNPDTECYDVYYSDSKGVQDSNGNHITISANREPPLDSDSNNIDAVELVFIDGTEMYGVEVTSSVTGACDTPGCPDANTKNILGLHDKFFTALGDKKTSITIALGTNEEIQPLPQQKKTGDGKCEAQADFDEDTIGDACDLCTDRDNDGYGDLGYTIRACPRSFHKTDNCPITFNPDQSDYDNDSTQCQLFGPLPYYTANSSSACGDMSAFDPRLCSFCGGDACDLDADNDRCFNWEKLKEKNNQFGLAGGSGVGKILSKRGEGYLQTGKYDETNWLAFSGDTDHDGLPTDCDAQTCGNAILENVKQEGNTCEDFSIGERQCEECDVNDFGRNIEVKRMSYMISNFCASCNNLQCQIKTFRTCLPLSLVFDGEHANISQQELQKKENRTEFLWVLDNKSCPDSGNIRRIVALDKVDGKVIGYNYNNVIAPKEKGKDNKGDFDVSLGSAKTRVWVPFEDAGSCGGGGDEGIIQEIVENNYTLSKARECVIGASGSGITLTAVDVRGNSWSYVNKDNDHILMQFAQDNATNVCPEKKEDHFYKIKNVGSSTHAIDIDSENNLWIVRNESIIKIDLDTIYEKFPNSTEFDVNATKIIPKNCLVKVVGSNTSFQCVVLRPISDGEDGVLGDITFDADNNAWIARLGSDFGVIKVSPDNIYKQFNYNDVGKKFGEPTFLTVDIQNNLWIATGKNDGKPDNFVVKFDIKNSKPTATAINPDGTTLYGLAADSSGYVWAMMKLGSGEKDNKGIEQYAEVIRWKIENNQLDGNIYKTISREASKRKRSLIRTGLTSKIIHLNSASSDYETDYISVVSSVTSGWSGSWGKVFYNVTPAQEKDKIFAEVSLGDLSNVGADWISIEEFNRKIGEEPAITMEEYAENKTLRGEIIGAYMKIRFKVPPSLRNTIKIDKIRVTCKDETGRNICQGGGNYKGAIIEPLPIAGLGEEAGEAPQANIPLWQGGNNPCNDKMVLGVGDVSVKKSTGSVAVPVFVRTTDIQCVFFGYNMEIRYDTSALDFGSLSPTDFLNTNLVNNSVSFQKFTSGVAKVTVYPFNNTFIFSKPVELKAGKDYEIGLLNFTIPPNALLGTTVIVNEDKFNNKFLVEGHGEAIHPQLESGSVKIE